MKKTVHDKGKHNELPPEKEYDAIDLRLHLSLATATTLKVIGEAVEGMEAQKLLDVLAERISSPDGLFLKKLMDVIALTFDTQSLNFSPHNQEQALKALVCVAGYISYLQSNHMEVFLENPALLRCSDLLNGFFAGRASAIHSTTDTEENR